MTNQNNLNPAGLVLPDHVIAERTAAIEAGMIEVETPESPVIHHQWVQQPRRKRYKCIAPVTFPGEHDPTESLPPTFCRGCDVTVSNRELRRFSMFLSPDITTALNQLVQIAQSDAVQEAVTEEQKLNSTEEVVVHTTEGE